MTSRALGINSAFRRAGRMHHLGIGVEHAGKLTLRHNSRLHHIGIGHDRAGTPVLMLIRDLEIRVIAEDTGELIRELVLDPSRDYQPTGRDRYEKWR